MNNHSRYLELGTDSVPRRPAKVIKVGKWSFKRLSDFHTYGSCKDCGSECIAFSPSRCGNKSKQNDNFYHSDYWVICKNEKCKNHDGEEQSGSSIHPEFLI